MRIGRGFYLAAMFLLFAVEIFIALYVHDNFVRPYLGDVLVVVLLYCFVRVWIPTGVRLLPFYLFLFAVGAEVLQYFNLAAILGLEHNAFFRILIGSVFDWKDILCYGIGCIFLESYQKIIDNSSLA